MSKCQGCGRENHNGNDFCNHCEEEYFERQQEEKYLERQREEEELRRLYEEGMTSEKLTLIGKLKEALNCVTVYVEEKTTQGIKYTPPEIDHLTDAINLMNEVINELSGERMVYYVTEHKDDVKRYLKTSEEPFNDWENNWTVYREEALKFGVEAIWISSLMSSLDVSDVFYGYEMIMETK